MTRYSQIFSFSLKYTFFCVVIAALLFLWNRLRNKRKAGVFFVFALLAFFSAIRCNVGSDYFNYYLTYIGIPDYFNTFKDVIKNGYQFGFLALSYLTSKVFGGQYTIFWIVSIIVSIGTYLIFVRYSKQPVISTIFWILSGFYLISNNLLKQYLAMMILMFAFFQLLKRRYIFYFILVLIASFFHITALIVGLIFLGARLVSLSKQGIEISLLIAGVIAIFIKPILEILLRIRIFSKYQIYFNNMQSGGVRYIGSSAISILIYLTLLIFIIKRYKDHLDDQMKIYLKMNIIGILILVISLRFMYLSRLSYYFFQFLPLLMSEVFEKINLFETKTNKRAIKGWLIFGGVIYCLVFTMFSGENYYYNYGTIFNDVPVSVQEYIGR